MNDCGAIILAGGQSRRMGQPKAFLRPDPDGPTLIERVIAAVMSVTPRIVLSANTPDAFAWLGLPIIPDAAPGGGPLAGLAAGLRALATPYAFLLGCDMPDLAPDLLRYLSSRRADDADAIVPLNPLGEPEPLCALYNATCLPVIDERLRAGELRMGALLDHIRTRHIPATELQAVDPGLRSFVNLNTPEDVAQWRAAR
jgi:molybdopterin-guanine dinucleotide biosynthesis protein A